MVYVISGKKNQGKTTKLRELFESVDGAYGFTSEKVSDCGRITTFVLTDLRSGEECTVGRLASLPLPENWGDYFTHGPYRFTEKGFQWARENFEAARGAGAKAYFIDELGKIELGGKGHADLIRSVIDSGIDLYITSRDINVETAAKSFGFNEYKTLEL